MKLRPWSPNSWRDGVLAQLSDYPFDDPQLAATVKHCQQQTPILSFDGVDDCRQRLIAVTRSESFLLHAGQCLERFSDSAQDKVWQQCAMLQQAATRCAMAVKRPVMVLGRMGGQYAKPRTSVTETRDGVALRSYHGDVVNAPAFNEASRSYQINRVQEAFDHVKNFWRHCLQWQRGQPLMALSHEALLLPYENAWLRPCGEQWYHLGAHVIWLGARSVFEGSAHLMWARGIANPVALKIGVQHQPDDVVRWCRMLNPENEVGKIILIPRYGLQAVREHLPALIRAVQAAKLSVLWELDPMHGNTQYDHGGKQRYVDDINAEIQLSMAIHQEHNSQLHGLHLELTHHDVTECIDRNHPLGKDAPLIDPQLNAEQVRVVMGALASECGSRGITALSTG